MADLAKLASEMVELGGSDLHVSSESVPIIRVAGKLRRLQNYRRLSPADTVDMISPHLTEEQISHLSNHNSLDTILTLQSADGHRNRFRCNFFVQRKGIDGVLRLIPNKPPELETLGLVEGLDRLAEHRHGLVLVTGPSGCGKSTTLAAMIHHLNKTKQRHVVTLEKPIEFLHRPIKCHISQRYVGRDTRTYLTGLRSALRQAPDVILVGELVDTETISMAMTAAETGHLILATMNTSSASSTIERIVSAFPSGQQQLMRVMLSESLRGIICQHLFARANGPGRAVANEVLYNTPAVSNLIRESRTHQLNSIIETGSSQGMVLMDHSLEALLQEGAITPRDALLRANSKARFESFMEWAL
ncbi:MAG: type IV pilus twitching motility protein PilT [Vulcanimicrobiota bacterium]